jgi:X-Pro dipeptidyl-peptidase
MNRWFTRYLYGVENGVEKDPRVDRARGRARRRGPTPYPDYPNPTRKPVVLFPHAGGNAVGGARHRARRDAGQGDARRRRPPSAAGAELAKAERAKHRLLYATPKLTAPLHLSGTARDDPRSRADKPACNLSVWLVSLPWTDATQDHRRP